MIKVLWAKIDTSSRVASHYDDMITKFKELVDLTVITMPLNGEHPATFHNKCYDHNTELPHIIENEISNNNYDFLIVSNPFAFYQENWGCISIPKAVIFEDQHNDNIFQLQFAYDNDFIVFHRYQFKSFVQNTSFKIKNTHWLPQSVDVDKFKDYGLPKKHKLLLTGALYGCYTSRNLVREVFKNDRVLTHIPRPKENQGDYWPIGIDYAKELNQSLISVCCGSIYQYSVMKHFEIPATNSLLYCDDFRELRSLGFIPNVNMITIDRNNIKNQVYDILNNPSLIKKISNSGMKLINEYHTTDVRAKELFITIQHYV